MLRHLKHQILNGTTAKRVNIVKLSLRHNKVIRDTSYILSLGFKVLSDAILRFQ